MGEPGSGFDLTQEPLRSQCCGELRPQDFERHLAVVFQIFGEVDRGHAAGADFTLDGVTVRQRNPKACDDVRHGVWIR